MERFQAIEHPIARGCTATYFPEGNALVPLDSVARGSCQPASKSVVITVVRSANQNVTNEALDEHTRTIS